MNSAIYHYSAAQRQADALREARRYRPPRPKPAVADVERAPRRTWLRALQVSRSAA